MLRLLKNKPLIIVVITIFLFIVMGVSASSNSRLKAINNIVSIPVTPIQRFLSMTAQRVDAALSFFKDIKAIKQENEDLKIRVNDLEKENRELIGYKDKIEELRQALNLKDRFASFTLIGANVIGKDAGNWFNIFKIDAGQRDGTGNDYPVITAGRGLVGRVESSDYTSSKVISIIDEDSAVSGWVSKPQGGPVIVRGDLALKEQGLCRMDTIPVDVDVEVNDIIETSGLGNIYPKGIVIGKVKEVKKTNSELNRYAIIEPTVDFKRLEEVFVLRPEKDNAAGSGK